MSIPQSADSLKYQEFSETLLAIAKLLLSTTPDNDNRYYHFVEAIFAELQGRGRSRFLIEVAIKTGREYGLFEEISVDCPTEQSHNSYTVGTRLQIIPKPAIQASRHLLSFHSETALLRFILAQSANGHLSLALSGGVFRYQALSEPFSRPPRPWEHP